MQHEDDVLDKKSTDMMTCFAPPNNVHFDQHMKVIELEDSYRKSISRSVSSPESGDIMYKKRKVKFESFTKEGDYSQQSELNDLSFGPLEVSNSHPSNRYNQISFIIPITR
jgi:hypothetical protein